MCMIFIIVFFCLTHTRTYMPKYGKGAILFQNKITHTYSKCWSSIAWLPHVATL